jgi:hypothetical protein
MSEGGEPVRSGGRADRGGEGVGDAIGLGPDPRSAAAAPAPAAAAPVAPGAARDP